MATYKESFKLEPSLKNKNLKNPSNGTNKYNSTELKCDSCQSKYIVETRDSYVCSSCGLVLDEQKIAFNSINFVDIDHYARLGKTNIGTVKERFTHAKSVKLIHLQKLHSIESNDKELLKNAKIEISRIFTNLNLPQNLVQLVYHQFIKIRSELVPGTKYRIPGKLVPLCIYFTCKFRNVSINEAELLEVSKISKKDFNAFKLQIIQFFPKYKERDRKSYILQKVLELVEHFKLGMEFYFQSKKILFHLWENIKNTKDEVITGLVASISFLCSYEKGNNEGVHVHSICKRIGIKMSTIQSQVKRRIFNDFHVDGFTTLLKSRDLLKKVINKMGLLDLKNRGHYNEEIEEGDTERKTCDIKKDQLNKTRQLYDHSIDVSNFYFEAEKKDNHPVLSSIKSYDKRRFYSNIQKRRDLKNSQSKPNKNRQIVGF